MQKGDTAKLKLLLTGISARMTKNRDYFVKAVCTFTSGKKKFDAELSRDGDAWRLRFQGSVSDTNAASFCAFFASEAAASASRTDCGTGSTGEPTDRSTMPPGTCAAFVLYGAMRDQSYGDE